MERAQDLIEDSAAGADDGEPARSELSLTLLPARLSIGPARVLLNWRLEIANTGQEHVVSLRIWSDMVCAHSSIPSDEQLGGPDMADARLHKVAILAPGDRESSLGEWQLPRDAVRTVDNAQDKLILPLARFRIVGAGIAPLRQAFVIGHEPAAGEERLRALHMDDDLQIHARLAARAIP